MRLVRLTQLLTPTLLAAASATGQAVFQPPEDHVGFPLAWLPGEIQVLDLNGDGLDDVLYGDAEQTLVVHGLGDSFETVDVEPHSGPARIIDLTGDGVPDLVMADPSGLTVSSGLGDGTFGTSITSAYSYPTAVFGPRPWFMKVFDATGDGVADAVIMTADILQTGLAGAPCLVEVYPGLGGGSFGAPVFADGDGLFTSTPAMGDLTGDGLPDLAFVLGDAVTLRLYVGQPGGGFVGADQPWPPSLLLKEVADLNGDGRLDLLARQDGTDTWFTRLAVDDATGSPTFEAAQPVFTALVPYGVELPGDLDGDALPDALVRSVYDIQVWKGQGDGNFVHALTVSDAAGPFGRMVTGDMDGDGRIDFVSDAYAHVAGADVFGVKVTLNATYTAEQPFEDQGGVLAGAMGWPIQLAAGQLQGGDPFAFRLANGGDGSLAWLIVGLERLDAPFKGGILGPAPDLAYGPFATDGGDLVLSGQWPSWIPSGTELFTQFWMMDGLAQVASSSTVHVVCP